VDRTKYTEELNPFGVLPVNLAHAKYTLPSHGPPVRSASMAVLSWNLPSRFGADEPLATVTDRTNSLPSFARSPFTPSGFWYVPTHTSPKVFALPEGSEELSEPANRRPSVSQARTGSPAPPVRTCALAA
jgi:hypothetical protein